MNLLFQNFKTKLTGAGKPWIESNTKFKALEGISFDLTCHTPGYSPADANFILPSGVRAETNNKALIVTQSDDAIRLKIIRSDKSRDEGRYECAVKSTTIAHAKVTFVDKPFLEISTKSLTLKVDKDLQSNVMLVIDYEGLPLPTFTWLFPNEFQESFKWKHTERSSSNQTMLDIKELNFYDAGSYTLIAKSKDLEKNITINLVVEGRLTADFAFSNLNMKKAFKAFSSFKNFYLNLLFCII